MSLNSPCVINISDQPHYAFEIPLILCWTDGLQYILVTRILIKLNIKAEARIIIYIYVHQSIQLCVWHVGAYDNASMSNSS
jgi:hypothetical protein